MNGARTSCFLRVKLIAARAVLSNDVAANKITLCMGEGVFQLETEFGARKTAVGSLHLKRHCATIQFGREVIICHIDVHRFFD